MEDKDKIIELLSDISSKLDIIVAGRIVELRKLLFDNYLTTEKRAEMYKLFDGKHSMQDISKKLNVTNEAVRQFKVALEQDKLIIIKKVGKVEYPLKLVKEI